MIRRHPCNWLEHWSRSGKEALFDVTLVDYLWHLFDRTEDPGQQASIMHTMAGIVGDIGRNCDFETARTLRVAANRLTRRLAAEGTHMGSRLAALADLEAAAGNLLLASFPYGEAAASAKSPGEWGRTVFNHGYLLRRAGYPAPARTVFMRIFGSDVDDRDPSPDIMEAYRNYRHRAAVEISRSYLQRANFPMAWWWAHGLRSSTHTRRGAAPASNWRIALRR